MASVSFLKMALLVCAAGLVLMALAGPKAEANPTDMRGVKENTPLEELIPDKVNVAEKAEAVIGGKVIKEKKMPVGGQLKTGVRIQGGPIVDEKEQILGRPGNGGFQHQERPIVISGRP